MKLHLTLQYCSLLLLFFVGETASLAKPAQSLNSEQRAARVFESVRDNPLTLHAFLVQMPKGADLHSHLSGAVYANDDAGKDNPSTACAAFLNTSEKAQEQWELEKRFRVFETNL